jgi:hypothetical protein
MLKRKQAELKSSSVSLSLHKWNLQHLRPSALSNLNIDSVQPFFPSLEMLFKTNGLEMLSDYGIRLDEEVASFITSTKIRTSKYELRDIHCKTTMILSPFKWIQGEYGSRIGLPSSTEQSNEMTTKMQLPHNAAYVGSLISTLLSNSKCSHFPKVYGVFSGLSKSHTIDISDDYMELSERSWFGTNIGKTFDLKLADHVRDSIEFQHTRTSRPSLGLGEATLLGDIEELETIHIDSEIAELQELMDESSEDDSESDSSSVSTSYIYKVNSCDCDDNGSIDEDDDDDDESVEPFAWASFTNVPVQTTVMEKCEGTLFKLITENPDTNKHLAWISQVMFALAFAQRNFGLVHNDLHSNNVMYIKTEEEYLYYVCNGSFYKVPTYGYLIKIIDFERGIASIKLTGMKESKTFMSDHFSVDEEAGGQYNVEPFYNSKFPTVKPNASFDLVRLATSLFWDLFPNGPYNEEYTSNPLFLFFVRWLMIDSESSIMFGKKDPHHDRYHGFHLYKAIARYCKDTAVPRKEIEQLKNIFGIPSMPVGVSSLTID